jgi:glyoxylase-like metal-dependent hydrolase (beta-lactamase superfamily II)
MATTTFKLGGMTVHRIIEMECGFTPALEFLPKLTPQMLDESRSWMRSPLALDDEDRLVLCFQSYIVRTGRHVILVDSCVGNDKDRPARPLWHMKKDNVFMQGLAEVGLTVNDIDFVLCTHLHVDHVGWNTRLENGRWVPTFPNALYLFSRKELDYWLAENDKTTVPPIADSVIPIVEAKRCDLVTSDHSLSDVVSLIPTPGHTIDHYAVTLGKGGRDAVITGDLIHSPLQAKWTDLAMRIDYDPIQSTATRRKFLETYCDTNTQCCFAHFPSPSRGYVKRWGDGFRCEYITG